MMLNFGYLRLCMLEVAFAYQTPFYFCGLNMLPSIWTAILWYKIHGIVPSAS